MGIRERVKSGLGLGLRQGDPLSIFFFKLLAQGLIEVVKTL